MSKVRRNNRKSRSSGGSSCDKSNRLYQIIPARNLSLPLLFLITNVIVYIYINWPSTTGSFVTGQFPRTKQQSNRTFRSAPPIPEEGNISCARSTVFPQRRTTPHARSNRERKRDLYERFIRARLRITAAARNPAKFTEASKHRGATVWEGGLFPVSGKKSIARPISRLDLFPIHSTQRFFETSSTFFNFFLFFSFFSFFCSIVVFDTFMIICNTLITNIFIMLV